MSSKNYSRNHFIPEGYLKGFALPDNNIYQLKISDNFVDSKISKKGLKQVCFKWDLYTIKNDITYSEFDIIDDSKFIEKNCFTDIENKIGETISRIQNEYFKIEEKQLICDFILLSITRHPKNLELFKSKYTPEMHIEYLEENKEDVIANARCANDLRPFEELKKSYLEVLKTRKEFDIDNLAKSYLHSTLLNLALNPEYERRTIFKNNTFRQFTIYKSITGLDFVTSLHPANSFHPQTGFNDNLLDKSSYTIPLNKNMVLEIGGEPNRKDSIPDAKYVNVNNSMVDFINFTTIQNSLGEVFGSNKSQLERYSTKEYYDMNIDQYKLSTKRT